MTIIIHIIMIIISMIIINERIDKEKEKFMSQGPHTKFKLGG